MPTVQMFAFNSSIAKELSARITPDLLAHPFRKADGSEWTPSPYQKTIFDFAAKGKGSALVKAVAGSGKTTTIMSMLSFIPGVKVNDIRAGTFHSVGYGQVMKYLGKKHHQMTTDAGKVRKIARELLGDVDRKMYADFCVKLVALAKGEGIGPLTPDTVEAWDALIRHHDLQLDDENANEGRAIQIAQELLQLSNKYAAQNASIDFDDMLYLPLLWKCRFWQNDWVIIDEAQDTNPVRRAIAKGSLTPGGRLVAVGDDKQAIYGFTGASTDAMDLIGKQFNCVTLPLTISYRCPKIIAERVKKIVPYFEVSETAIQGEIVSMNVEDLIKNNPLSAHDVVVCRQAAPLLTLAFRFIAKGIGCTVLGKDIGAQLVSLIEKQNAKGIEHLLEKLEAYREREVAKFMAKGEEQRAEALDDRIACIRVVVANLSERERTVPGLKQRLESMFSDTNGVLTLSTIHKVKGREYKKVAILSPELSPSKWARQDWQYQQELHLMYVRDTRVQEMLIELTGSLKEAA